MAKDRASRGSFHASGEWGELVPDEQWEVYRQVIDGVQREGIPVALGGAFALATYSGFWRDTKDLDLYTLEEECPRIVEVLTAAGLTDYFDEVPYDRGWIYRGHKGETIVDAIWGMPNRRSKPTPEWLTNGPEIDVRGKTLRVIPPEELIFAKIFVLQRPRCDWPDIINVIYGAGRQIDWEHLIGLLGPDVPLLRSVLSTFAWLAPGRAREFASDLWRRIDLPEPGDGPDYDADRVRLLETRPWFAPLIAANGEDRHAIAGHP
jgi:hypothetical protein